MLIFLHYYRKMKYFLFYNCLKVSSNPACFGEGFTRSGVVAKVSIRTSEKNTIAAEIPYKYKVIRIFYLTCKTLLLSVPVWCIFT
jgi:hypothetical protein